jgi:hypothetical protein
MDQDLVRVSRICTDGAGIPDTDPPTRKSRCPAAATAEEEETGIGGEGRGRGGHPGCGSSRKKRGVAG